MTVRITILLILALTAYDVKGEKFGGFEGDIVVKWDDADGRTMILVQPFAYIAPNGVRWEAPIGARVDGASIPQFAWSIIGGPFEGRYRKASVVHDVACDTKARSWQSVHEAFYTAMLAAGVDSVKAKIMYAAVYHFGPRWARRVTESNVPIANAEARAKEIASGAAPDETTRTQVNPISKLPSIPIIIGVQVTGPPPDHANIAVSFEPLPRSLNSSEFESLKDAIAKDDLPLDAIRHFAPPKAN